MIKLILSIILYYIGLAINWHRMKVLSVYFHNPSPFTIEKFVKWAKKHHYKFIDRITLESWIEGQTNLEKRSIFMSFDDAWQGNLELLPILERYNIPATIFAPVKPLECGNYWWEYIAKQYGYKELDYYKSIPSEELLRTVDKIKEEVILERTAMTKEELIQLGKHPLIDIQSHSYSHPILTNLNDTVLVAELKESRNALELMLQKDISSFSYPNGSLTEREVLMARKIYKSAYTTEANYPHQGCDMMKIPRIAQANDYWSNLAKIVGTWQWIKKFTH